MLRRLARRGIRRGVVDGSRPWLFIGLGAAAVSLVRRLLSEEPEPVWRGVVAPGERLLVTVSEPDDAAR